MEKQTKYSVISITFAFFFSFSFTAHAEGVGTTYPDFSKTFDYIVEDYVEAYDRVVDKDAVPYWWAIGLSTAALLAVDDKLIAESKRVGKKLNISDGGTLKTVLEFEGQPILRLPTDLGSVLYYIGDGWTHTGIAAGFLATGAWTDNEKTSTVGYELIEGMITTTIATQFLKHITGHETPNRASSPRGNWDFFPNQRDYADCVPCYDAFPSGHVAVASMTLTVISKNYSENPWVMPIGSTLIGLLAFQMMNNGVHWASDYPLAIGLGYTFGSIAYERGERALAKSSEMGKEVNTAQWTPIIDDGALGVGVFYQF